MTALALTRESFWKVYNARWNKYAFIALWCKACKVSEISTPVTKVLKFRLATKVALEPNTGKTYLTAIAKCHVRVN